MKISGFRARGDISLVHETGITSAVGVAADLKRRIQANMRFKTGAMREATIVYPVGEVTLNRVRFEVVVGVPYASVQERGSGIYVGNDPIVIMASGKRAVSFTQAGQRITRRFFTTRGVRGSHAIRNAIRESGGARPWSQVIEKSMWEFFSGQK